MNLWFEFHNLSQLLKIYIFFCSSSEGIADRADKSFISDEKESSLCAHLTCNNEGEKRGGGGIFLNGGHT